MPSHIILHYIVVDYIILYLIMSYSVGILHYIMSHYIGWSCITVHGLTYGDHMLCCMTWYYATVYGDSTLVVQHITLNYFTLYDFIFHFLWPCLFHHGVFSLAHLAFILFLGKPTGQPLRENLGRDGVFLRGCFATLHHDGEEKNEREIVHALTFNCTQHPLLELM